MTTPIITSGYNLKTDPSASSLAGLKTMNKGVAQYNAYNALSNADLRRAQRKAGRIDNGFINNDLGGASGVVGLASSVIDMGKDIANRAKGPDMTNDLLNVKDQANAQYKDTGFDSLNQTWQNNSLLLHKNKYDFGYKNGWQRFKDFNVDGIKGFMKGFGATGNPWVGLGVAAANQISGLWAGNQGNKKAERAAKRYNLLADDANTRNQLNFNNQLANIQRNQQRSLDTNYAAYGGFFNFGSGANSFSLATDRTNTSRLNAASKNKITSLPNSFEPMKQMQPMQSFAFGGNLESNGMTVDAGFSKVGNGGTHEENPNQGVQVGVDPKGVPNKVEEGEVIHNDYVYSNRLKVPAEIMKKYHLGRKPITFADAVTKITKEKEEKPNDPIVNATTEIILKDMAQIQEETREMEKQKKLEKLMAKLSPEEQQLLQEQIQQGIEQGVEEQIMQAEQNMQGQNPEQMDPAMQEQMMQEQMMQQQMAQQGEGQIPPEAMVQGGMPQQMAFGGSLYAYGGNLFDGKKKTSQMIQASGIDENGDSIITTGDVAAAYNQPIITGDIGGTQLGAPIVVGEDGRHKAYYDVDTSNIQGAGFVGNKSAGYFKNAQAVSDAIDDGSLDLGSEGVVEFNAGPHGERGSASVNIVNAPPLKGINGETSSGNLKYRNHYDLNDESRKAEADDYTKNFGLILDKNGNVDFKSMYAEGSEYQKRRQYMINHWNDNNRYINQMKKLYIDNLNRGINDQSKLRDWKNLTLNDFKRITSDKLYGNAHLIPSITKSIRTDKAKPLNPGELATRISTDLDTIFGGGLAKPQLSDYDNEGNLYTRQLNSRGITRLNNMDKNMLSRLLHYTTNSKGEKEYYIQPQLEDYASLLGSRSRVSDGYDQAGANIRVPLYNNQINDDLRNTINELETAGLLTEDLYGADRSIKPIDYYAGIANDKNYRTAASNYIRANGGPLNIEDSYNVFAKGGNLFAKDGQMDQAVNNFVKPLLPPDLASEYFNQNLKEERFLRGLFEAPEFFDDEGNLIRNEYLKMKMADDESRPNITQDGSVDQAVDNNSNAWYKDLVNYTPELANLGILATNLVNGKDYSDVRRLEEAGNRAANYLTVSSKPTGTYANYKPVDMDYALNKYYSQANSALAGLRANTGYNPAQSNASLLAMQRNIANGAGDVMFNGQQQNYSRYLQALQQNNALDQANAQMAIQAAQANQNARNQAEQMRLSAYAQGMQGRHLVDQAFNQSNSVALNNIVNSLESRRKEDKAYNMINSNKALVAGISKNGDIYFKGPQDSYNILQSPFEIQDPTKQGGR